MALVDIIIVNHNTEKLLSTCLRSIYRHSNQANYRVIVIDNGSQHPPKLAQWWRNTTLLRNHTNCSLAATWNQGIQAGKGDYILILNPDVFVSPGWLTKMINHANSQPKIAMVGCKHVNKQGKIVHAGLDFNGRYRYKGLAAKKYGNRAALVLSVSGGCFLIKRGNLAELGLFDENYFLYYEDTDYAVNAVRHGFKVLYCPVPVRHDAHGTPISNHLRRQYIKASQRYFRHKWKLNL